MDKEISSDNRLYIKEVAAKLRHSEQKMLSYHFLPEYFHMRKRFFQDLKRDLKKKIQLLFPKIAKKSNFKNSFIYFDRSTSL